MTLPRSTPAEQGVDSTGIDAFIDALAPLREVELHSLMVLRHGQVVAERWWRPYTPESSQLLYSLSKSFTSTALGLAVAEGLVDLDATVLSYFPELDSRVTDERSRSIRVRHVAAMASGHDAETGDRAADVGDGDMLLGFLLIPPDREPGTVFAYNQPCTYSVGEIVRRVSGGSLIEYLRPRLFEPLGITSYGWHTDPLGRELGYSGLHLPTEAIAKLGQLYLSNGEWAGRRILPEDWVAEATRSHIATNEPNPDWRQGYGFQFWQSRHGYRGDGAYGQYMVILPEADAVVAITSQSADMQAVLDALWTHLLPALTAGTGPAGPWPAASPVLDGPKNAASPGLDGPAGAGDVPQMMFRPGPGNELAALLEVRLRPGEIAVGELVVALGSGGGWTVTGPVATAYGWAGDRLQVDVVFTETPHRLHLTLIPATATFEARWQTELLADVPLTALRRPG